MNSQQELLDAINTITQSKDRSCDTPATVLRVEGDVAWVHIDGGADETPVQKTINCSEGETVQVRISNGSAFLVGNASAPPTDDTTANVAHFVAVEADAKATEAIETANAIVQTVHEKVDIGDSNIQDLSSTMYQNANGVNIYNDTLAVGDSYAHIDGNSFDIKQATTAGTIDDANDTMLASFGREVTVGTRATGETVGDYSQVFGYECIASGDYSHSEGYYANASGDYSHSEGAYGEVEGDYAHAEGFSTYVTGNYSHAEGFENQVSGSGSHVEGSSSVVSGDYSHAEGEGTLASGYCSHSEGSDTRAEGNYSHAQNYYTTAASANQTTMGKYNVSDSSDSYALIIGNGTANNARSDALRVDWSGNVLIDGEVQNLSGTRKYVAEPSSEGTNGQVLTTDGSGGRSWTTVSGGVSDAYKNIQVGQLTITASGEDTFEIAAGTNITLTPDAWNKKVTIAANNTPKVLTSEIITVARTSYTFSDASITTDSVIDIYDTIFGFAPTGMTVSTGSATITFPAQSSTHTIKLFVY